jgi:hypothetical protein
METKREMSKEYKHKSTGAKAIDIFGKYKITGKNGEGLGTMCDKVVENPDFGWEKVKEPFKENDWTYFKNEEGDEWLYRFSKYLQGQSFRAKECYLLEQGVFDSEAYDISMLESPNNFKKPTPDQIERILSIVARAKGFDPEKERMKINRPWMKDPIDMLKESVKGFLGDGFSYQQKTDSLLMHGIRVYEYGNWATILPEKATEPQVEVGYEYTCIKDLICQVSDDRYFEKGKRYMFKKNGSSFDSINDLGGPHSISSHKMHEWFDMGQDWKTAKVEDTEKRDLIDFLSWYVKLLPSDMVRVDKVGVSTMDNEDLVKKYLVKKRAQL